MKKLISALMVHFFIAFFTSKRVYQTVLYIWVIDMKYIQRSMNGIRIYDKNERELKKGLKEFINSLCIQNLSTMKGREEAASIILNKKSVLPVYINEELLLVPTESVRNYNCIYFNIHKVLSFEYIENKKTKILFDDLTALEVPISMKKLQNQLLRSRCILNTKLS